MAGQGVRPWSCWRSDPLRQRLRRCHLPLRGKLRAPSTAPRSVGFGRVFAPPSRGSTGRRPGRGVRPLSRPVLDREVDGFEYLVEFLVDLGVPEAHHSEAL